MPARQGGARKKATASSKGSKGASSRSSSPASAAQRHDRDTALGSRDAGSRFEAFEELSRQRAAGRMVALPRQLSGQDRRVHVRQTVREDHEQRIASRSDDALAKFDKLAGSLYSFFRGIDYIVDECPNSVGATQLVYKDMLNRLEAASPGSKLTFVQDFLRKGRAAFAREETAPPQACEGCGMPSFGTVCSFCKLAREVETKRERRRAAADVTSHP